MVALGAQEVVTAFPQAGSKQAGNKECRRVCAHRARAAQAAAHAGQRACCGQRQACRREPGLRVHAWRVSACMFTHSGAGVAWPVKKSGTPWQRCAAAVGVRRESAQRCLRRALPGARAGPQVCLRGRNSRQKHQRPP